MDDGQEAGSWWVVMMGDVLNLPFRDGSFDKIICSEVLEHVADDNRGIGELVRVLKKGGIMAVTVPTYLSESIYWMLSEDYHNHPGGHIRKYQAQQLIAALRRNNLRVFALRWEHAFHTIYWFLRCAFGLKNEKAFIPALYYSFLEQEIISQSKFVRFMEGICNYFFPKSIIVYTQKV
jgi:SAM-dependent methyltransferase